MGEENADTNVASASGDGSNLPVKSENSVIDKKRESTTKKEHDENNGIEESVEEKTCNKMEFSENEEVSIRKLAVKVNENILVVLSEDAKPKESTNKEIVALESEKNDAVKQDNEPNEGETKEVVELECVKSITVKQDNEPEDVLPLKVAGKDNKNSLTIGEDKELKEADAAESAYKAAAEDETLKKETLGGINEDTKAAYEEGQIKVANVVNDEEMRDNNVVQESKENNGDVDKDKMEVELEHIADKSDNGSIDIETKSENKDVDVKNGSETEHIEGRLDTSNNEEDKQENDKGSKKRKIKEKVEESQKTPVISVSTRPVRERKSVERLVASVEKEAIREFFVEKGPGVALIDIPNVASKLSKKKNDETFKQLHSILFGRRGKAIQVKNHVSQFSGFVWHDNEEKNKMKVREKFDKLVKEKLIEFCDVLDLPIVNKVSTKKEDVVTRLMEFLASPHSTTEELLSEKENSEKTNKRKRSVGLRSPNSGSANSSRTRKKTSEKLKVSGKDDSGSEGESENQENVNGNLNLSEDESSEKKSRGSEDAMDEDTTHHRQSSKKTHVKVSTKKSTKNSDLNNSEEENKGDAKSRRQSINKSADKTGSTRKARTSNVTVEKKKQFKDVLEKEYNNQTKNVTAVPKGKPKEEKLKPSDKVLRNQICQILKEVDFNTATFTDILKLLSKHFKTDLTPRKASIKLIIQEELTIMADAADDDDEEEEQNVTPEAAKVDT